MVSSISCKIEEFLSQKCPRFPSKITFFFISIGVINNTRIEVRNELGEKGQVLSVEWGEHRET